MGDWLVSVDSATAGKQAAESGIAQIYGDYLANYGARQGGVIIAGFALILGAVLGPFFRWLFRRIPREVCDVRERIDLLGMLKDHNRDELIAQIQVCHGVSRIIATQMLESRIAKLEGMNHG